MKARWTRGDPEFLQSTARAILEVRYARADATRDAAMGDTLRRLPPEDLQPVWEYVDSLEQVGWIRDAEASRWKDAIRDLMESLGLDTECLLSDEEREASEAWDSCTDPDSSLN